MSTPAKPQLRRQSGEAAPAEHRQEALAQVATGADKQKLANEPNNNNNNNQDSKHAKQITSETSNTGNEHGPAQRHQDATGQRDKQKLTASKLNAPDEGSAHDAGASSELQIDTSKCNSKQEGQQGDESSERMGSVISNEQSSESTVAEASSSRVVKIGDDDDDADQSRRQSTVEPKLATPCNDSNAKLQPNAKSNTENVEDQERGNEAAPVEGKRKRTGNDDPRRDNELKREEAATVESGRRDRRPTSHENDADEEGRQREQLGNKPAQQNRTSSARGAQIDADEQHKLSKVEPADVVVVVAAGQPLEVGPQSQPTNKGCRRQETIVALNQNHLDNSEANKQVATNCHHHKAQKVASLLHQQHSNKPVDQLELGSPTLGDHHHNHHHSHNNDNNNHHHHHHHHQANNNHYYNNNTNSDKPASIETRRLSYLQSLLLRKWPCLALTICIMSSLLFGILLSGLTVYLMHGVGGGGCSELASHWASSSSSASSLSSGGGGSQHHLRNQHHSANLLPHELVMGGAPIEASGSSASSSSAAEVAAASSLDAVVGPPELTHRQLTDAPSKAGTAAVAPTFQRLPSSVVPQHYELFFWPYIAEPSFHFNGSVEIRLTCRSPTDNITLHTLDLVIDESSLRLFKVAKASTRLGRSVAAATTTTTSDNKGLLGQAPRISKLSQDKQLQYSIVHLDAPLEADQDYLLRMDFVGTLNDDLAGFYKIKYERQNSNETTWIAATQFQATDARRAFPCFDEPLYKATFGIRLKHWRNMTALSNMPIVASDESPDGLWITDTFAKSQRMSTYLVAFAVTDFESRTAGNITVWTRPGIVHTADYALSIAGKILRHYEDFFGIAYPLPKMDMIALPDFNAGAMENWGLITYRETAMLYDENSSSVANKQRVAVVVAHELAHQWFGNLVTPKWWDDLWLNEGFASFVEYIGVDHVEPKWRMLDQFVVDEIQDVFKLDGLSSSHQISIPVNNPDEISEIFDHISYSKGASIIRMMNHFLTERVFKAGLQRYLKALKYSNAEQSDLWAHLTGAQQMFSRSTNSSNSNNNRGSLEQQPLDAIDVGQVMNSWTLQTGYPLVTLTRDYAKNTAQLDQVRYQPYKLLNKTSLESDAAAAAADSTAANATNKQLQRWQIPITYTWKSDQNWQPITRLWMRQDQTSPTEISNEDNKRQQLPKLASEWMIVNVQQMGYYRVNYDLQNWRLLIGQLQEDHTKIGTTNRAQLLDDIFELAKSSLIDYELAMEATKYLKMEREYLPWESVLLSFGYIDEMLLRTAIYGNWQDYFAQLIEPYYERYKDLDWSKPVASSGRLVIDSTNSSSTAQVAPAQSIKPTGSSSATEIDANDVLEHYNQVNAVAWACAVNIQHCIDKAIGAFRLWKTSGVNNIRPALRHRAYCTAIEFGTKDDWDFLWRVYEKEQNASERDRILRALGCSRELWILSRYLEWTFSKTKPIRRQDGSFVFRVVAKNDHGRDLAFNFMRERWSTIKDYYGKSTFSLGSLIKSVATSMNTQLELDQLKTFYESIKADVGTGKRSFQIAIEEVEFNVHWRNLNYKILEKWLEKQRGPH